MPMIQPVKVEVNGKTVGTYYPESNTYVKLVKKGLHLMKMMDGYGMEQFIYERLVKKDSNVTIIENGKKKLTSHVTDWKEHGVTRDFGHGMQRFLSRKYMKSV